MANRLLRSHKVRALLLGSVYLLSRTTKRDPNLWLFAGLNSAFLDNAKYLFLHVVRNHPEIEAYFVSDDRDVLESLRSRGLPCLYKWSRRALKSCLRARYYFISAYVDDINFWTSGKAVVINLWHGIPLKKIEFDITTGKLARRYQQPTLSERLFKPWFFRRPDFVISTSEEVAGLFASAFRISREQCPILGYPRTDILLASRDEVLAHIKTYESQAMLQLYEKMLGYRYVVLYAPTWRDDRSAFLKAALPDVEELNSIMEAQDALMLIKLHPNDASFGKWCNLNHILSLDATIDVYPLLPFTTHLVTDYSSIYFDYMLLRKPMLFYPFDLETYRRMRGFYFDYEQVVPGTIAYDFYHLKECLSDLDNISIGDRYGELLRRFWHFQDGNSSERIVEFVKGLPC